MRFTNSRGKTFTAPNPMRYTGDKPSVEERRDLFNKAVGYVENLLSNGTVAEPDAFEAGLRDIGLNDDQIGKFIDHQVKEGKLFLYLHYGRYGYRNHDLPKEVRDFTNLLD